MIKASLIALAAVMVGCAEQGVTRVDRNDTQAQVTTTGVDLADWEAAAAAVTQSMIGEGTLADKADEKGAPAILIIDAYINNTTENIDRDKIVRKVKSELRKDGNTRAQGDGPGARQANEEACFRDANLCGDFFLTLKIIEDRASDRKTNQRAFLIQMALFDPDGFEVWDGEEVVIKQEAKRRFGL